MPVQNLTIDEPVLLGNGPAMEWLRAAATRVAGGHAKVLITGESGVGKDLVARFVHARSLRASRAFVALNCAGISETLLESELFGHVRGSFTGAHRDKVGLFQLADKGTVFLDEVGEMSLRMQALLLRFLENGEVKPVGSDRVSAKVDVRVIAATNRNLADLVSRGLFREDLMYRIMVVHIEVPPLRNRREDIRALVAHIIDRSSLSLELSAGAMSALEAYHWPGTCANCRTSSSSWPGCTVADTSMKRICRPTSSRRPAAASCRHANAASELPITCTKGSPPARVRSGSTSTRCSSIATSRERTSRRSFGRR
jgi:transcriptional regulator with GAF, ATPase, and Fis domain